MIKSIYNDTWNGHKVLISKPNYKVRCGYKKSDCECKHHSWFSNHDNFKIKHGIEF